MSFTNQIVPPPLSPAAQQLAGTVSERQAAALKVWRECAQLAGAGVELSAEQVAELADATFVLGRTADLFDRHLTACRDYLAMDERLGKLPTREEYLAKRAQTEGRLKEIDAEIERLKLEKPPLLKILGAGDSVRQSVVTAMEQTKREFAELFAD